MKRFNKKGVSLMIAYVLLIVIGIALAIIVFNWLKFYVAPSNEIIDCPEGAKLIIKEYKYEPNEGDSGTLNITVFNRGVFNVEGFVVKVHDRSNAEIGFYILEEINKTLKTGEEIKLSYNFADYSSLGFDGTKFSFLEVQPFIEENGAQVLCRGTSFVSRPSSYVPGLGCVDGDGFDERGDSRGAEDQVDDFANIYLDSWWVGEDTCYNETWLKEYYCNDDGEVSILNYDCSKDGESDNICEKGICTAEGSQEPIKICKDMDLSDPDQAHNASHVNYTLDEEGGIWNENYDYCEDGNFELLYEQECNGENASMRIINCSTNGEVCFRGSCVENKDLSCEDSDGGIEILVAGETEVSNLLSEITINYDKCESSNVIRESYCDGNISKYTTISCPEDYSCRYNFSLELVSPYSLDISGNVVFDSTDNPLRDTSVIDPRLLSFEELNPLDRILFLGKAYCVQNPPVQQFYCEDYDVGESAYETESYASAYYFDDLGEKHFFEIAQDFCDNGILKEGICHSEGPSEDILEVRAEYNSFDCSTLSENGEGWICNNGLCEVQKYDWACNDPDDGENDAKTSGIATTYKNGLYSDSKSDMCDGEILKEAVCTLTGPISSSINPGVYAAYEPRICPDGYECSGAKCILIEDEYSCEDSDGGQNYYTSGIAKEFLNDVETSSYPDFCGNQYLLMEYYCNGNSISYQNKDCKDFNWGDSNYICKSGACIDKGPEYTSCFDSDGHLENTIRHENVKRTFWNHKIYGAGKTEIYENYTEDLYVAGYVRAYNNWNQEYEYYYDDIKPYENFCGDNPPLKFLKETRCGLGNTPQDYTAISIFGSYDTSFPSGEYYVKGAINFNSFLVDVNSTGWNWGVDGIRYCNDPSCSGIHMTLGEFSEEGNCYDDINFYSKDCSCNLYLTQQ